MIWLAVVLEPHGKLVVARHNLFISPLKMMKTKLASLLLLIPVAVLAQGAMPPAQPGMQQNQMIRQGQSTNQSGNVGDEESKRLSSSAASKSKTVEICTDGKCITVTCSSPDVQTNYCD